MPFGHTRRTTSPGVVIAASSRGVGLRRSTFTLLSRSSRCAPPRRPRRSPLVLEVIGVAEREQHPRQVVRLEGEHLGVAREEVAEGGEELGGVHGSTHALPRTCSRAISSLMP